MRVNIEIEESYGNYDYIYDNAVSIKRGNSHYTITFEDGTVKAFRNNLVRKISYQEEPIKKVTDSKLIKAIDMLRICRDKEYNLFEPDNQTQHFKNLQQLILVLNQE